MYQIGKILSSCVCHILNSPTFHLLFFHFIHLRYSLVNFCSSNSKEERNTFFLIWCPSLPLLFGIKCQQVSLCSPEDEHSTMPGLHLRILHVTEGVIFKYRYNLLYLNQLQEKHEISQVLQTRTSLVWVSISNLPVYKAQCFIRCLTMNMQNL